MPKALPTSGTLGSFSSPYAVVETYNAPSGPRVRPIATLRGPPGSYASGLLSASDQHGAETRRGTHNARVPERTSGGRLSCRRSRPGGGTGGGLVDVKVCAVDGCFSSRSSHDSHSCCHQLRRTRSPAGSGSATPGIERHLPLKDVAAAGGWRDTETLLKFPTSSQTPLMHVQGVRASEEKAPQRNSLQGCLSDQSGRRDLNPRP